MLILGHAGIALGAATLLAGAVNKRHASSINKISWFTLLSRYLDIRLLLVGSLLPDIIDKPVGQYFFSGTFSYGRIFAHTLLFLIIIAAIGFYLYKSRRSVWLLTLAAGTFMHLVLDELWLEPQTLFWPFLGITFERTDLSIWMSGILQALISDPKVYVPEVVGFVVLVWFGLTLIVRKKVGVFIKYGRAG